MLSNWGNILSLQWRTSIRETINETLTDGEVVSNESYDIYHVCSYHVILLRILAFYPFIETLSVRFKD
jgi:hypothetical protein